MKQSLAFRLLPCSAHKTEPLSQWLSAQAEKGLLFRGAFLGLAWFTKEAPQTAEYDIRWHTGKPEQSGRYAGRMSPGYTVFRTDGAAGTTRQKNTGWAAFLLVVYLLGAFLLLHAALRGDPANELYPEWLLQWDHFFLLPLICLFVLSALAAFSALCPGLRKRRLAGLHYCRVFLSLLLAVLLCVCVVRMLLLPGYTSAEPIFSETRSIMAENRSVLPSQVFYYENLPDGQNISMSKAEFSSRALAESYCSWLERSIDGEVTAFGSENALQWRCIDTAKKERYILILSETQVIRLRCAQNISLKPSELVSLAAAGTEAR